MADSPQIGPETEARMDGVDALVRRINTAIGYAGEEYGMDGVTVLGVLALVQAAIGSKILEAMGEEEGEGA